MNIEQIRAHIDHLIRTSGSNYRSLSLQIGKNEAYLHQYINKGSPLRLPEPQRRRLAELLEVDEQELTDLPLPKTISQNRGRSQTALVEMISSQNLNHETIGFLSLPKSDFINITSKDPNSVKMLRVVGDSMVPTLKDRDYILADFSSNQIDTDGLYLIRSAKQISIKRIQQLSPSEVVLISDNTNYKPISVNLKKLEILAKVFFVFRTEKIA